MLHWLIYLGLVAVGAGLVLSALIAALGAQWLLAWLDRWLAAYAERQAQLTAEKVKAAADSARDEAVNMRVEDEKRGKAHWGAVQASEVLTGITLEVITDGQVMTARLENLLLRAEWIRAGGNPEAPWATIVNWKNRKRGEP